MIKKVIYHNRDNPNYIRVFANTAIIQAGPRNDLVIDFHEEYISPRLLIKQTIGENLESEYNFPEDELNIISERKCSVTMSRKQAIELARYILDTYGEVYEKNENHG